MIASRAAVGAVCLRCQIQLLRRLAPVRCVTSDATPTTERVDDGVDGEDAGRDANQNRGYKSRRPARSGFMRLSLHKQHVSKNRVLTETSTSLGSEMLGQPAYALVMRDGGLRRRKSLPSMPNEEETGSSGNLAASIEAAVESQRQPPTREEARSNIHNHQPKADRVLSRRAFRKIYDHLLNGFLSAQLEDYIEWHKLQEPTTDTSSRLEFPWLEERSPWVPLPSQTDAADRIDPKLHIYEMKQSPKGRLVLRLMRDCWGLSIDDQVNQMGETQIKLRSLEFTLLMRGTQRFINTVSRVVLEPGEIIEASQDQETLRFVTTQSKVDSLLRELDDSLKGVQTKTFPIALIGYQLPPPDILELVGQITNTKISTSDTERRLHVSWIEIKSRAARNLEGLEDMAHVVLRLLLTASGSPHTTSTLLSPEPSQAHPGRLIVNVTSENKLGWKDRVLPWARYAHPLTPEKSVVDAALPIEKFKLPFEPLARPETIKEGLEFFAETNFPTHPIKWSNAGRTSTTAHFGYILHPYEPENQTPLLSDLLASTDRRVFAPSTPHPLHLVTFESNDPGGSATPVTTKTTLVLRFWPSPSPNPTLKPKPSRPSGRPASVNAGDTPPAPILELRLAASDNQVKGVESLRAVTRTHHTDVMLPSSPVDVRFTQTQYEVLQAPDGETLDTWQPIADFLEPARLDLENGKLEMPPRQRFPIPRCLLAEHFASSPPTPPTSSSPPTDAATKHSSATSRWYPGDINEFLDPHSLVSISYEFVGLEVRRSTTLLFEDHELTYTSVEGGRGGGRRTEVTLEPREPPPRDPVILTSLTEVEEENKDQLQKDFLARCHRFATDRFMWSGHADHNGTT